MPAKNTVKQYIPDTYYHIYNRGVEKRKIFQDPQDYAVFLSYLKEYLLPKDVNHLQLVISSPATHWKDKDRALKLLKLNNFSKEITLLAYSLMPNHFHLLIKQSDATAIDRFMQSLSTRYTMYFNRKYKRVGSLFQAVYKAVPIITDEQFLHLTRYIHRQSVEFSPQGETLRSWKQIHPSSFAEYVRERISVWVKAEDILSYFNKDNPSESYENFVRQQDDELIAEVSLDDE